MKAGPTRADRSVAPRPHPRSRAGLARRFARDTGGAYAVEFAFAGGLFIVLTLVLVQYALVYLARDSLALALQQATRSLLTGTFQTANAGNTDQAQILRNLRATICGQTNNAKAWMFDCANLKLEIGVASSFATSGGGGAAPIDASGAWSPTYGTTYICPGPRSVAVLRAAVKYPVFARGLSFGLSDFADGSALLQAAAVFRVEPYQSSSGSNC